MARIRIGYLVSRYPAISHSFILREVMELKRLGFDVQVASINDPDRSNAALTDLERQEASLCFYVKTAARPQFGKDVFLTWLRAPGNFARAFAFACGVSGFDIAKAIKNFCYLGEAALIAAWMKRLGLSHLHVHFATPAATVALFVSKLAPIEFSITVHGPDEFYNVNDYLLRQKCFDSRFLCVISHYASSQLMRVMPVEQWPKVQTIPLGVDPDIFLPAVAKRSASSFTILCVGRLVPEKGQHVLLEAFAGLRAEGRDVTLILVGDGPHRKSLEAFAKSRQIDSFVTFTGSINQDQIRPYYSAADIFVLASFAEGVPVVLMEAMAMEIPCIATWVAGIPELILNGTDGILVPPASPAALQTAISRLMDDKELRISIGQSARRKVMDKYNLKSNVRRLGQVFQEHLEAAA